MSDPVIISRKQVEEILLNAKKYKPAVLQNESHPYLHEKDLRDYCRIHKIAFQAYSSLGSADRPWRLTGSITSGAPKTGHEVLSHPDIVKVAAKHGKTTANVVLRWHLQVSQTLLHFQLTTILLLCPCSHPDFYADGRHHVL